MTLEESKVTAIGGGLEHALVEVLELCIAAIENVKKYIENVDKCIAQVRGSINPIGKKNKIARLEKVRQHLVEEHQEQQKEIEEEWLQQEQIAQQERIHHDEQNHLIKEQQHQVPCQIRTCNGRSCLLEQKQGQQKTE